MAKDSSAVVVKAALSSGSASTATLSALQSLLDPAPTANINRQAANTRTKSNVQDTTTARKVSRPRKGATESCVLIHEDGRGALLQKDKYALATEVVNITLRVLTAASKVESLSAAGQSRGEPRKPARTACDPSEVLKPRSANSTPKSVRVLKLTEEPNLSTTHLVATAECARLAFAYLRSASPERVGAKASPRWQLETGMLALASRLVTLGMDSLAVKELRVLHRRLQEAMSSVPRSMDDRESEAVGKETLATLLSFKGACADALEVLSLVSSHQLLVLKMIAARPKPATFEGALEYLRLAYPNSPANVLEHIAKASGGSEKASKQLEALAQLLSSSCPSPASSSDADAVDRAVSPSPAVVFQLQTLVLQIRQRSSRLSGRQIDRERDLVAPFSRCLTALLRRLKNLACHRQLYELATEAYMELRLDQASGVESASFEINRALASLAEGCHDEDGTRQYVERLEKACSTLEPQHARRLACEVKRALLDMVHTSSRDSIQAPDEALRCITERLSVPLTGRSVDYDMLATELARLTALPQDTATLRSSHQQLLDLTYAAATYAQRYARSYSDRNCQCVQAILRTALRHSKTLEQMQKWVTEDAARVYIQDGTLRAVADAEPHRPKNEVWAISASSIALDKILHALTTRAMKLSCQLQIGVVVDDESLNSDERGLLLERQLNHALSLAGRSKYRIALQKYIPDTLHRLSKTYTRCEHPLRRAAVNIVAIRIRSDHPDLLPPHALKGWLDDSSIPDSELGKDVRIARYAEEIKAGLALAKAFHDSRPAVAELRPSLLVWKRIMDSTEADSSEQGELYDRESFATQLKAVASYFGMLGEAVFQLAVSHLLLRLVRLHGTELDAHCVSAIDVARQYVALGHSEKAHGLLAEAKALISNDALTDLTRMQLSLAHAEYHLAIHDPAKARSSLDDARGLRERLPPESVAREDRRTYELLHADGWLLQSKLCMATGMASEGLVCAKRAVRLLNATWTSLEHTNAGRDSSPTVVLDDAPEPAEPDVSALATGVSKLQLVPTNAASKVPAPANERGAAFWPVLPVCCRAMMHLSDLYVHHGLYTEAEYYSGRAVSLAESVQSTILLSRTRYHRSRLMTLAGRLEDAELCLTKSEEHDFALAKVERYRTEAGLRIKEGHLDKAASLYKQAIAAVRQMQTMAFGIALERISDEPTDLADSMCQMMFSVKHEDRPKATSKAKTARATTGTKARRAPAKTTGTVRSRPVAASGLPTIKLPENPTAASPCLLARLETAIISELALVCSRMGNDEEASALLSDNGSIALQRRHVDYTVLMRKVTGALDSDVSYNLLLEATLAFPSLVDRSVVDAGDSTIPPASTEKTVMQQGRADRAPNGKRVAMKPSGLGPMLVAARDCLLQRRAEVMQLSRTSTLHLEYSMITNAALLLSAAALAQAKDTLHPVREALHVEQARMHAKQCETRLIASDADQTEAALPFTWPPSKDASLAPTVTALQFQEDYINILPKSWTAVSLCLNDDGSELYAVRYQASQSPLILRLPFSRHKPDDEDEEAFDYHKGKAELQEIIQISNYSCHNTKGMEGKGAKCNWWAEREALDKRMHELLINMENIWFGGFRGILSQQRRRAELLARFRVSFEDVLARYLPSRQSVKGRAKLLALDNKVLELFTGLGDDRDGFVDLDEQLADLLYFVVDMLQFNGEQNAYDEIDFDGMAVDVLDALRSYHEACPYDTAEAQHLILVLDKRLQAFPWESMPCLEAASVSRVGSMSCLRERILAIRQQNSTWSNGVSIPCDQYAVGRNSGTYIINPSKDLTSTQSTLSPPLVNLASADGADWRSIVAKEPSEADFRAALTSSSILLYFGHGAGSQYIRPRTIRKLEKCSDVVWLMGCSSGAVTEYGELEPFAVPLTYLLAGSKSHDGGAANEGDSAVSGKCMAVVATLWDVTDKDIDRFSLAVGQEWGLWPASEAAKLPAKTPKKRERLVAPSTPPQVPKTPKTPKVRKTPARSRSRSQPRRENGRKQSLVEAVARSRDACYLRYLNGAATVVYGVPVYLGD